MAAGLVNQYVFTAAQAAQKVLVRLGSADQPVHCRTGSSEKGHAAQADP